MRLSSISRQLINQGNDIMAMNPCISRDAVQNPFVSRISHRYHNSLSIKRMHINDSPTCRGQTRSRSSSPHRKQDSQSRTYFRDIFSGISLWKADSDRRREDRPQLEMPVSMRMRKSAINGSTPFSLQGKASLSYLSTPKKGTQRESSKKATSRGETVPRSEGCQGVRRRSMGVSMYMRKNS